MINTIKTKFKKSKLHPIYCKLRGWEIQVIDEEKKNKTWIFNAGNTFGGNPKWLFIYVNKYRKDIDAYWFCDSEETTEYVRSLGYKAYTYKDKEGWKVQKRTGVFVVEQVKEQIPMRLKNAKMLNLFHGVGCKSIERKVNFGFLNERIAKKYITNNTYYKNNQLFLVTSPLMEKHFKEQCGIDDDKVIRAGYPRCIYQKYNDKIVTFDHNLQEERGLSADAKIAAYVPTYRDGNQNEFFGTAIPNMDRLVEKLQEKNMLLIFKMHPQMEKDYQYVQLKEAYKDCPNLMFWDNKNDFYEVFDKIDLAIIDYSSIFYDMLVAGVPHFVRYFFDYDVKDNLRDMVFDLKEMTCGKVCNNFEEFINVFDNYEEDDEAERQRIYDLFWEYSGEDSFEKIIEETLAFEPEDREFPDLYTFDIFDTLFSRKVLKPRGIFYYVREQMQKSDLDFPSHLMKEYPDVRAQAEANVRQFYDRTQHLRDDDWREIKFDWIFDRMRDLYPLTDEQIEFLKEKELEAELDNVIPLGDKIGFVEELLKRGDKVVLISDMYLPEDMIKKMLVKANPILAELPLFLSSEWGVQKTTKKLFLKVYQSFEEYNFNNWYHYGDNRFADFNRPKQLGILPRLHGIPKYSEYEEEMVKCINTYDAHLVAANMARFRFTYPDLKAQYVYNYVALYFVPYVIWAVNDAIERGIDCLYFISRDGHHLKQIADTYISEKNLNIKTKYIYGSRKAWRFPSYIDGVDEEFYLGFGNFAEVKSYGKLLQAVNMEEEEFLEMFPGLSYVKELEEIDGPTRKAITSVLSQSKEYEQYVLNKAAEERKIVDDYFKQEINWKEKFAFVEYWGRGYTQDCFARLLHNVAGEEMDVPYYYVRSIYPTQGHYVRYNFTSSMRSLIFVEAIFANIPYKSVASYYYDENGKVMPTILPADCDMELDNAMNKFLPLFVKDLVACEFLDEKKTMRELFNFSLDYYAENQEEEIFVECLAPLIDSVGVYGDKREFACELTPEILEQIKKGAKLNKFTRSVPMTLAKSSDEMVEQYTYITEVLPQERKEERKKKAEKIKNAKQPKRQNDRSEHKLLDYEDMKKKYDASMSAYADKKVNSKLVMLLHDEEEKEDEFISIRKELQQRGYKVKDIVRQDYYSDEEYEVFATAAYIILNYREFQISLMPLKEQTKVVQLTDAAYKIKNYDFYARLAESPFYMKELLKKNHYRNYAMVTAASEEQTAVMEKSYGMKNMDVVKALGFSATDVYFDKAFCKDAKKKINELFPNIGDKKVIAYIPKYRRQFGRPVFLDIMYLKKYLSKKYVIAYISDTDVLDAKYYVENEEHDFARDVAGLVTYRELLAAADVIIGDYLPVFFEACMLNKPVFMSTMDQEAYWEKKEVDYSYEEIEIGPSIGDNTDLLYFLDNIEEYDYSKMKEFKDTYFSQCDGKVSKRIVDSM